MKTLMMTATMIVGLVINVAHAGPLPEAKPDDVGFSQQGLSRIDDFFARAIAANRVPGAVVAVARDGKLVHYKAYGYLNRQTGEPMPLDAIFNLASMTKVFTVVGGLTLNEEGRLPLKSRLDEYFPQFAHMRVGTDNPEPARPIFIHD